MSYIGIVCNYISKGKKHIQMNSFLSYKENYFYFMLKAFCVVEIFKFCLDFLVMQKKAT